MLDEMNPDCWNWRDRVLQEVARTGDHALGRLLPAPGERTRILMKAILVERLFERKKRR